MYTYIKCIEIYVYNVLSNKYIKRKTCSICLFHVATENPINQWRFEKGNYKWAIVHLYVEYPEGINTYIHNNMYIIWIEICILHKIMQLSIKIKKQLHIIQYKYISYNENDDHRKNNGQRNCM